MTGVGGVVNVILNLVFIPKYGVFAAAWTTVAATGITVVLALIISSKHYPLDYDWRKIFEILLITAMAYSLSTLIPQYSIFITIVIKGSILFLTMVIFYVRNYGNIEEDIRTIVTLVSKTVFRMKSKS